MTTDELIQLMRTVSLAQVRKELDRLKKKSPREFQHIVDFYTAAANVKPT